MQKYFFYNSPFLFFFTDFLRWCGKTGKLLENFPLSSITQLHVCENDKIIFLKENNTVCYGFLRTPKPAFLKQKTSSSLV